MVESTSNEEHVKGIINEILTHPERPLEVSTLEKIISIIESLRISCQRGIASEVEEYLRRRYFQDIGFIEFYVKLIGKKYENMVDLKTRKKLKEYRALLVRYKGMFDDLSEKNSELIEKIDCILRNPLCVKGSTVYLIAVLFSMGLSMLLSHDWEKYKWIGEFLNVFQAVYIGGLVGLFIHFSENDRDPFCVEGYSPTLSFFLPLIGSTFGTYALKLFNYLSEML